LDAQKRLRNANVLLVGLGGLGAEVAKNLMLSGLKSLTLMDDEKISKDDYASQFLISGHGERDTVGENRAKASQKWTQELNPMVEVHVSEQSVDSQPEEYFRQFDVVILTDQKFDSICRVNKICRLHNIKFQAAGVFGWCGYSFNDFNNHTFLMPKPRNSEDTTVLSDSDDDSEDGEPAGKRFKSNEDGSRPKQDEKPAITVEDDENVKVPKKLHFPSFEHAMNTDFESKKVLRCPSKNSPIPPSYFLIRVLLRIHNGDGEFTGEELEKRWRDEVSSAKRLGEVSGHPSTEDFKLFLKPSLGPVCAILGGVTAQEGIKAISQDGIPFKNLFLYNALDCSGIVCDLPLA